jgi:hypothetical protein
MFVPYRSPVLYLWFVIQRLRSAPVIQTSSFVNVKILKFDKKSLATHF